MRLSRYINEKKKTIDISEYMDIVKKDCSKIIKVYQEADEFLYRGISSKDIFLEKKGRGAKARIPRDMPIEFHRLLNSLFKEKFGWKVRDGISTTPNSGWTGIYGDTHIFFPTNNYKFAWSPKYGDLYRDVKLFHTFVTGSMKKFAESKEKSFKRIVNTYKDTNLVEAIKTGQTGQTAEIMFKVGKYYMLNIDATGIFFEDVKQALGMS